ncbi:MAG: hypothetical protein P9E24_10115 [Candidatus Competibacter sp.]|nr:hypothetical protein [Candidatus Competibacter sp.]MDG4585320.1 hypothetical protein [Candidatus Competibacter sp.]
MKKIKITIALVLSNFVAIPAIAADVYRWTDPETGSVLVMPSPPPYPVKESRSIGSLPSGEMIELILDTNAPSVKALIEKRKVREAEETKKRAAREAEGKRIVAEEPINRATSEDKQKEIIKNKVARMKESHDKDVLFMISIMGEFLKSNNIDLIASKKGFIIIDKLQNIKNKLDLYEVSKCYSLSKSQLQDWMDYNIKSSYKLFVQSNSDSPDNRELANAIKLKELGKDMSDLFWLTIPESCSKF